MCSISNQVTNCLTEIKQIKSTYNCVSSNVFIKSFVFYISFNLTLHHSGAIIILYEAFPSMFNHEARVVEYVFLETLFSKILNCVVVSIGQKVMNAVLNCMIFQFAHQASPVALNLFRCCDCQENNFSELLLYERSKYTTP